MKTQKTRREHTEQRRPASRKGVLKGAAALVGITLATLGVAAGCVGAVATDSSTVRSNEFAQSLRVEAGVYNLSAAPDSHAKFGSDPASGTVSFEMHPSDAAPLALRPGDKVTTTIVLPRGMQPTELPSDEHTSQYHRTWQAEERRGVWQVTSTIAAGAEAAVRLPAGEFQVSAAFPDVVAPEDLVMKAEAGLPERFTSTHGSSKAHVPVEWAVQSGVYDLAFARGARQGVGEVSFVNLPAATSENLYLRPGDALVTTVELPAGVDAGALPQPTIEHGRKVEWATTTDGPITLISRTETAVENIDLTQHTPSRVEVLVDESALQEGFTISAIAVLPERFVSTHGQDDAVISGKIGPPSPSRVAAGHGHSLIVQAGEAFAWGAGGYGQLGSGDVKDSGVPVFTHTPDGREFTQVVAGWEHSMAIADDGTLWGWGDNTSLQTGTGEPQLKPVTVPKQVTALDGTTQFTSVSAGWRHTVALSTMGTVYVWGDGNRGVFGDGSSSGYSELPKPMPYLPNKRFVAVEAGFDITFALTEDGEVWGTGSNEYGFLGLGESVYEISRARHIPMPVSERVVQVSAASTTNNTHVLALTESGTMIGWGLNASGESGVPVAGDSSWVYFEPVELQQPDQVRFTKLAAGDRFSLGLSEDGRVYSWGGRALGTGSNDSNTLPTLTALPAGERFIDIAAGDAHAFAVAENGQLYGWGSGEGGRLGNNSGAEQPLPIVISVTASRSVIDATPAPGAGADNGDSENGVQPPAPEETGGEPEEIATEDRD